MEKKLVLHILNSKAYSGAENVVFSIIRELDEYEHIYVSRDGAIRQSLEKAKIRHVLLEKLSVKDLKKIVREYCPDIIHAHDFTASILVACTGCKSPVISHLHHNPLWIRKYGIKSITYFLATKKFSQVLAVSDAIFQEYVFGSSLRKKGKVIFNPINASEIRRRAEEKVCAKYKIISVGRLAEEKNPKLFVDIVKQCLENDSDISAAMIGDGELREEVETYIQKENITHYIDVLGFKENPYVYLKCADILCIPSLWEGFGMAAVEALVLGKPVVAAAVGGLIDIVDDSCGKICFSKEEYVAEINRLLSEQAYYKKKSEGAINKAMYLEKKIDYYNNLREVYAGILNNDNAKDGIRNR